MKKLRLLTFALIALMLAVGAYAQQQPPSAPTNVEAKLLQSGGIMSIVVYWNYDQSEPVADYFGIYIAMGKTDDLTQFKQFATVRNEPNSLEFKYALTKLQNSSFSVFVKSFKTNADGTLLESAASNIANITVEQKPYIYFSTKPNTEAAINQDYYYSFRFESNVNCPVDVELLAAPQGMQLIKEKSTLTWKPDKPGQYEVAIQATASCDKNITTIQKYILNVGDGQNKGYIKFVPQADMKMQLFESLTFKIMAESNIKCPIVFAVQGELPEGMYFDQPSGMFKFTPMKEGVYVVKVLAYLECQKDVSATQEFKIVVGKGNPPPPQYCATIKGTVKYDDAVVVPNGNVMAWKIDKDDFNKRPVFNGNVNNGEFKISVPEGNYAVEVMGNTFYPEWYKDADFITDAERISIKCNEESAIDLLVKKLPEPKLYKVSGTVLDAKTKDPLYAYVYFMPVNSVNKTDPNGKPTDKNNLVAKTNEKGEYTIDLPDTYVYMANAVCAMNSKQYMVQYYDKVSNPTEADMIELKADMTDVNFELSEFSQQKGMLSGVVTDDLNTGLKSKVIAQMVNASAANSKRYVMTVETDAMGTFKLENMPYGDYVLLSVPIDMTYVPGYYKLDDFAVLKWEEATKIAVSDNQIDIIYQIKHRKKDGIQGIAKVEGTINESNGGLAVKKTNNNTQSAIPVSGAFVFVTDKDGNVSDYGFSDNTGYFGLKELGQGKYTLVADKVGYSPIIKDINTDYESNAKVNLDFSMEKQADFTDVKDELNNNGISIYPSPAVNSAEIRFQAVSGTSLIEVYNSAGEIVSSKSLETIDGINNFTVETAKLSSGKYFVRITQSGVTKTVSMEVVK